MIAIVYQEGFCTFLTLSGHIEPCYFIASLLCVLQQLDTSLDIKTPTQVVLFDQQVRFLATRSVRRSHWNRIPINVQLLHNVH